MKLTHAQLETLWVLNGGPQASADTAAAIAQAESGGNSTAILNTAYPNLPNYHPPAPGNLPEYSISFWQINQYAHKSYTIAYLKTRNGNATAAVAISHNGTNFNAWSTYTTTDPARSYRRFLTVPGSPVPTPPPAAGTSGIPAPATRATKAWRNVLRSLDQTVPSELRRSAANRRRLSRI